MSELNYLSDRAAAQQISERVELARRARLAHQGRRRSGRHALARSLHRLADRLDV